MATKKITFTPSLYKPVFSTNPKWIEQFKPKK